MIREQERKRKGKGRNLIVSRKEKNPEFKKKFILDYKNYKEEEI